MSYLLNKISFILYQIENRINLLMETVKAIIIYKSTEVSLADMSEEKILFSEKTMAFIHLIYSLLLKECTCLYRLTLHEHMSMFYVKMYL